MSLMPTSPSAGRGSDHCVRSHSRESNQGSASCHAAGQDDSAGWHLELAHARGPSHSAGQLLSRAGQHLAQSSTLVSSWLAACGTQRALPRKRRPIATECW